MLIGCTRKVAAGMKKNLDYVEIDEDPLYQWQVTQFEIYGDKILLFMNVLTRFPLFIHHVSKEDYQEIEDRFLALFMEALRYLRVPREAGIKYLENQKITYCKTWDRSILSQMNDLAYVYKYNVMHGAHNFYPDIDASIDYAEIPCVKYQLYPKQRMQEEMMQIYASLTKVES